MTDELKPLSGMSAVPELKDDGSNWFDFHRRLEEVLTMNGYASTIKPACEPSEPHLLVQPPKGASAAALTAYKTAFDAYPGRVTV
jgi:hypothetical protein